METNIKNAKFICNYVNDENQMSIDWLYGDVKSVAEEFVLSYIDPYFGPEMNELATDYLKEKNVEAYIDVVCDFAGYLDQATKSLIELKPSLCKLVTGISFDEVKEIVDEVNRHLVLNGHTNKFICFDNFEDANNFLNEHFNKSFEEDKEIFDSVIFIKK